MPLDHEKLRVYQNSLTFLRWLRPVLSQIPKSAAVHSQLDRAATSIPLNIAEGNGKRTSPDRVKFFDVACGSALECAACLDVAECHELVRSDQVVEGKVMLEPVVRGLIALMKSHGFSYHDAGTGARLREEGGEYLGEGE